MQVEEGTGDAGAGARLPDSLPEEPQRVSGALRGGGCTAAWGNPTNQGFTKPVVLSTCGSRWEGRASSERLCLRHPLLQMGFKEGSVLPCRDLWLCAVGPSS